MRFAALLFCFVGFVSAEAQELVYDREISIRLTTSNGTREISAAELTVYQQGLNDELLEIGGCQGKTCLSQSRWTTWQGNKFYIAPMQMARSGSATRPIFVIGVAHNDRGDTIRVLPLLEFEDDLNLREIDGNGRWVRPEKLDLGAHAFLAGDDSDLVRSDGLRLRLNVVREVIEQGLVIGQDDRDRLYGLMHAAVDNFDSEYGKTERSEVIEFFSEMLTNKSIRYPRTYRTQHFALLGRIALTESALNSAVLNGRNDLLIHHLVGIMGIEIDEHLEDLVVSIPGLLAGFGNRKINRRLHRACMSIAIRVFDEFAANSEIWRASFQDVREIVRYGTDCLTSYYDDHPEFSVSRGVQHSTYCLAESDPNIGHKYRASMRRLFDEFNEQWSTLLNQFDWRIQSGSNRDMYYFGASTSSQVNCSWINP